MIFSNSGFLLVASAVVLIWTPLSDSRHPGFIVGGINAKEGELPYQVSIQYNGQQFGGGSILDNCWILTAAHCVYGFPLSLLSILAGTTKLNSGGVMLPINKTIYHENYSANPERNDIALIRLKHCIQFDEHIQPVQLGTNDVGPGYDGVVSGWGYIDRRYGKLPNDLMKLQVRTITNEKCNKTYHNIVAGNLCALNAVRQGFCQADSGGPLVDVKSKTLIGVVSTNHKYGCALGVPDIYTRISTYVPWIRKNMIDSIH